jgi:hypothetical protein
MSIASRPKRTTTTQAAKPASDIKNPTQPESRAAEAPDRGGVGREAAEGRLGYVESAFSHGRSRS